MINKAIKQVPEDKKPLLISRVMLQVCSKLPFKLNFYIVLINKRNTAMFEGESKLEYTIMIRLAID